MLAIIKKRLLQNWKAGLTVSLISTPLAIALALGSGATPTQGIITAFWAGLLGAIFGSSNFNIIGPTGALSGVLIAYAITHGAGSLPIIAIVAGFIIFLCYIFRLDKYIIFIPKSVVHGFTLGVAFIIGFGQIDNALGLNNLVKTEHFIENVWLSLQNINQANWLAFAIFFISTLFIYFWNKKFNKLPGAIIVAFLSILIILGLQKFGINLSILTLGDKYPDLRGTLFINIFNNLDWHVFFAKDVLLISIATAIIAVLETLLSGQIANHMTKTKFDRPKEILGLSIANIGSGLMGGIPATAALARTALNIKSGAQHKTSGVINASLVGFTALFFLNYFKLMPMAVIAAILVIVAIGMVEKEHFIHLIENHKTAFFISIFVAAVVVVEDPIMGIAAGTIIALLIFVNKISYGQTEVLLWKDGKMKDALLKHEFLAKDVLDSDIVVYKISGTLTYVNMPAHVEAVEKIKNNKYVIISLRHAFYADADGVDYLGEIIEILKKHNDHIIIAGINREIERHIHKTSFYKQKLMDGKIYNRTSEAIADIVNK